MLLTGCATTSPYTVADDRREPGCWLPQGRPAAVLLAVHGLNDHRGAFRTLAEHLVPAGVAVYSYDQHGFGATPQRGQWPGIGPLADDLRRRTYEMRWRHPGVPLFVLGESMGAAVALVAFSDYPLGPDGIILSAPAVLARNEIGPIRSGLVQAAASLFPNLRVTRPAGFALTDDAEVEHQLARDPWLIGPTRLEVVAGVLSLMDVAARRAHQLYLPVLLLYGKRDPLISPQVVERLAGAIRGPVRTFGHDGYHLLLRGRAAEVSAQRILAWLSQQPGYRAGSEAETVTRRCDCPTTRATEMPATSACRSATRGESSNAAPERSS